MIYLNQAGTSWPKPAGVVPAGVDVLQAEPSTWPATFHAAHARVARAFGLPDARRLLLTPGCTQALAIGLLDHPWERGDRLLTSAVEHHALMRPASQLEARGVDVVAIGRGEDGPLDLERLEGELRRGGVRLVAMTAACNVTGELLPIEDVVRLAHAHHALCLLDGAQVGGWLDVDLPALGVDLFTFAGHTGLHGPWGIGGLYVAPHVGTHTPEAHCELPAAGEADACLPMPGYCDAGSVDLAALAGLAVALDWLAEPAQAERLARGRDHIEQMSQVLERLPGVRLLGTRDGAARLPTVAFTVDAAASADVAAVLRAEGLLVGSGLQCAPRAHESLGSVPAGAVRLSAGPTLTAEDAGRVCEILRAVAARGWRGAAGA
ncbi:MAG: aminotransferase class V-fold PLP-dependent enzyme, partial [Planctomycetota bacterium]|nr:aminotransferase class V-fold PLP-dependent enzyme [Planctomycetota bacterium]